VTFLKRFHSRRRSVGCNTCFSVEIRTVLYGWFEASCNVLGSSKAPSNAITILARNGFQVDIQRSLGITRELCDVQALSSLMQQLLPRKLQFWAPHGVTTSASLPSMRTSNDCEPLFTSYNSFLADVSFGSPLDLAYSTHPSNDASPIFILRSEWIPSPD
jgi:hypothetical protein